MAYVDKITKLREQVREHIQKDLRHLEDNKRVMDIELFLREKHSINGKIDMAIELGILNFDSASRFLQHLDSIRYF